MKMKIRQRVLVSLLCCIVFFVLPPIACTSGANTINPPPFQSISGLVEKLTLDDLAARVDRVLWLHLVLSDYGYVSVTST
jgi:hypothetical protein